MSYPHYTRHLKLRSEKLRSIMHDMWVLGNESNNIHEQPEGQDEKRKDVLERLIAEGFAELRD
jgi:regulator of replication initiation timing